MASEVFVNIKNLPETEQINNGDYLIVETPGGTNILNFENFIITAANTTFSNLLSTNNVDNIQNITTSINALSTTISQTYPKMYYVTARIKIPIPDRTGSVNITTVNPSQSTKAIADSVTISDIYITPANANALVNPVFVTQLTRNDATINVTVSHAVSGNDSVFNINIVRPYYD